MTKKNKRFKDEYWHINPNGVSNDPDKPSRMKVKEADLPPDAEVVIMGMVEDMSDNDEIDSHWKEFHANIAAGKYVKLVKGGDAGVAKAKSRHGNDDAITNWNPKNQLMTLLLLEQFLEPEYWNWSDDEKKAIGHLPAMMVVIRHRLENAGIEVSELYGIIHDKDLHDVWDPSAGAFKPEPKDLHIHVVGKLKNGATIAKLAAVIGVPEQQIEKPKSGRYIYVNKQAYLIHAKDAEKYQYNPQEVYTECGEDYMKVYARCKLSWEKGRAKKIHEAARNDVDWLIDKILDGSVTLQNIRLNDDYYRIYSRNRRRCDEALDTYAGRKMALEVLALERGEYSMSVIYIVGKRGAGKSLFAGALSHILERIYGWRTAKAASEHPTESLKGEEVFLMDDVRVSAMNAAAWLQLFDAHHANPVKERYHNKESFKPRVIIITSTLEPLEFFYYVKNQSAASRNEALDQFFRRITHVVHVRDHGEYGVYNCRWSKPVDSPEYSETVIGFDHNHQRAEFCVSGLTIAFKPDKDTFVNGEMPAYSPWGLAEAIMREIDSCNGSAILERPDASDVFASIGKLMQVCYQASPMPLPDSYATMPHAIPESETPPAQRRLMKQIEESRKADQAAQDAARKAAEVEAREQARLNTIIGAGEFAGMTVAHAERITRDRKLQAKYAAQEQARQDQLALNHAENLDKLYNESLKFVATNTEQFPKESIEPLFDNNVLMCVALREHLKCTSMMSEVTNEELLETFHKAYQVRFPDIA